MATTRSLKELYKLVLAKFESDPTDMGICISAHNLEYQGVLSYSEIRTFMEDFYSRRPEWYNSLFWYSFSYTPKTSYWWHRTEEGRKCRIKFLKHIINKLK